MNETAARYHGKHVIIHTDGACIGNPGKGGWAAILQLMDGDKEERRDALTGSVPNTTNNQMELKAAIEGLRKVTSGSPILVRSDSQYVVKGATEWLPSWKSERLAHSRQEAGKEQGAVGRAGHACSHPLSELGVGARAQRRYSE